MIILIKIAFFAYNGVISPILKTMLGATSFCRYSPSCSVYALRAIEKVWYDNRMLFKHEKAFEM